MTDRPSYGRGTFGAGVLAVAFYRRRRIDSPGRALKVVHWALVLALGLTALDGGAVFLHGLGRLLDRNLTDVAASTSPCGPFGLDDRRWDRRALAKVNDAFPDYDVKLVHRCVEEDDSDFRVVRLRIGRFMDGHRPTALVVGEKVTFDGDQTTLAPYASEEAAERAYPRLDTTPALIHALGHAPRLCLLDGGYGGFTGGWWLDCVRLSDIGRVDEIPDGWPAPAFARDCDETRLPGSRCFEVTVDPGPAHLPGWRRAHARRTLESFAREPGVPAGGRGAS